MIQPDLETSTAAVGADGMPEKKEDAYRKRYLKRLRWVFCLLLAAVAFVYTFTTDYIPSSSMEPTLRPGDRILTLRGWLAYPSGKIPSRGDIVLFQAPAKPEQPGETANADPAGSVQPDAVPGRKPIGIFHIEGDILIKRVVGLPGETVQMQNGKVLINGKPLTETYEIKPIDPDDDEAYPYAGERPVHLGSDEIFVLGDNRANSDDSRFMGPILRSQVISKYQRVLWHIDVPKKGDSP